MRRVALCSSFLKQCFAVVTIPSSHGGLFIQGHRVKDLLDVLVALDRGLVRLWNRARLVVLYSLPLCFERRLLNRLSPLLMAVSVDHVGNGTHVQRFAILTGCE